MTSPLELLAAALLLVNVWLVARRSLWNYAFGIAAVLLYALIFWEARLYAVFVLQFLFLALNLYGLWNWRRAASDGQDVPVGWMGARARAATALAVLALTGALALLLARTTDAASPLADSLTTALSLAAQYWQARRRAETWALWSLVNLASVWLYATQALWATAAVYALLLAVAVYGWRSWARVANGDA
jgi:nicotinamide mononucleotide transporter